MRITSGFMTNLSGDNIDSSTGSGIEGWRVLGANRAVWRTGGGRMRVSGANLAVWRTGGGWMGVSGANKAVWRTGGGFSSDTGSTRRCEGRGELRM